MKISHVDSEGNRIKETAIYIVEEDTVLEVVDTFLAHAVGEFVKIGQHFHMVSDISTDPVEVISYYHLDSVGFLKVPRNHKIR